MGQKFRTYVEAKRRVKEVVENNGLTLTRQSNSMTGFEACVKVMESRFTEMKKENEKIMSLFQKMMEHPDLLASFVPKSKDLGLFVPIVEV